MSRVINVSNHHGSNYFTTAKNSVFGECAYVQGAQYKELQSLLNISIRLRRLSGEVPLLEWGENAPKECKRIGVYDIDSFKRHLQRHLYLTPVGEWVLQHVLVDHYKTMQTPARC